MPYSITFTINDEITVTRDQLLLLPSGEWISASDIKLGTELAWSVGEGSKGSILIDTIVPIMPNAPTFPELELDKIPTAHGMDICFVTSSKSAAWLVDSCWIFSCMSENASLSISISFFT